MNWMDAVLFSLLIVYCHGEDIETAFKLHKVVKDVVGLSPPKLLFVEFDSGVNALLGNTLTPSEVKNQPTLLAWPFKPGQLYTIIMTDPDAPSRENPSRREFLHWLVTNVPNNDIQKGSIFAEYVGAGPPISTSLHRYVFLVYLQDGPLSDFDMGHISKYSSSGRPRFRAQRFADKHRLGSPIAGNFFQAEYDSYVPILHQQLSS